MKRRSFLRSLVGGMLAAQQLDIEKLLWVPGAKTIFLPPEPPDNSSIWLVSWEEDAARVLFYGDTTMEPETFTGLAPLIRPDPRLQKMIALLSEPS